MSVMDDINYQRTERSRVKNLGGVLWGRVISTFDAVMDALEYNWRIVRRESDIFLGTLLFLLGFLNFHSGRYCDGNTADYLSCTRPVTYYYYTWLEMILIILGVTCILLWFMKRERR